MEAKSEHAAETRTSSPVRTSAEASARIILLGFGGKVFSRSAPQSEKLRRGEAGGLLPFLRLISLNVGQTPTGARCAYTSSDSSENLSANQATLCRHSKPFRCEANVKLDRARLVCV